MRLWSFHPRYLDPQGLVALWREGLLAKAVLQDRTRGYRHHPQLHRFQAHLRPRTAIAAYLREIHAEAQARGYAFDRTKIGAARTVDAIPVTEGQLAHEWEHLLRKLSLRSPEHYRRLRRHRVPDCHPLLTVRDGPVEPWERAIAAGKPR